MPLVREANESLWEILEFSIQIIKQIFVQQKFRRGFKLMICDQLS